ncbi:731_t:CDS:1, partial [Ambispora gerdemannii]
DLKLVKGVRHRLTPETRYCISDTSFVTLVKGVRGSKTTSQVECLTLDTNDG